MAGTVTGPWEIADKSSAAPVLLEKFSAAKI